MTVGSGEHPRVPDRVPTAPDLDVSYDSLVERERLGSGGTADVAAMAVTGTDEVLAVKQPRAGSTLRTETVERFVAEAETWSKLDDHDHVVGVVDWGETPLPWIALEYMDGGSLADRLGQLSTEEALWVGVCTADGVWSAHRRGVAHLDLTPRNVLFRTTPGGTWDVPKVSDWGLARLLLERSSGVEGLSPRYASPEQLDPDAYGAPDDRSDVYQLGTIVYELLTGEPVFEGTAAEVAECHLHEAPTPPTSVAPSLPAAADDAVLPALAKDREERYESMLDFRRELAALFGDVATDADRSTGSSPRRLDPLDAGENGRRVGESGPASSGPIDGGSSLGAGSDGRRVLDRIREQSRSEHERRIPWQHREEAPGLEPPDGDSGVEEPAPDGGGDPAPTESSAPDDGASTVDAAPLYGAGLVVGLSVTVAGLAGGAPPALFLGLAVVAGSLWKLVE